MPNNLRIRPAVEADLSVCLSVEQSLREDRPKAGEEGFLLASSDTVESYRRYLNFGAFYVAEIAGEIVGFTFGMPPDSDYMEGIRRAQHKFRLSSHQHVFDIEKLAWLAKVGVKPSEMRRGYASMLYQRLIQDHPNWHFLTTTVREPLRNLASEALQRKFGFECIGTLPLGGRGTFENVICDVHYRRATE